MASSRTFGARTALPVIACLAVVREQPFLAPLAPPVEFTDADAERFGPSLTQAYAAASRRSRDG
jgi:hypothetical protein